MLLGATLFEGLQVLESLGPELGGLETAKLHLIPLRKAKDWRELRDVVLRPLRNEAVFHNDADVLPRALATLELPAFEFATCEVSGSGEPYYELADYALFPAIFARGSYDTVEENSLRYANDVLVYAGYFCRAADLVLAEVAEKLGFAWQETDRPVARLV